MTARTLVKALALAAALMPLAAAATVVMQLTMEELADRSPVIVRATVEGSKPVARADGSIWTVTRLAVTERLKGAGTAQVVVKQPGGGSRTSTRSQTMTQHTAIISANSGKGKFKVLEQNVGPKDADEKTRKVVQENTIDLGDKTEGKVWIYRPVAK